MSKIREALRQQQRLLDEIPKYRENGILGYTIFVARCPTMGCSNTVRIQKIKNIEGKCRSCSSREREVGETREYRVYTTDIDNTHLAVSRKYHNHFIREEITTDGKAYVSVLRCPVAGCQREIRIRSREKLRECNSCCRKGKPFERTFNQAKKRAERTKRNGISIQWLLSYDELSFLCQNTKCHYCNQPLDRAEFKSDEGSTSILLDRKDSNKDYTLDNCVPCCPDCNFTKNERISYDEMVLIMKHRGLWVEDKQCDNRAN